MADRRNGVRPGSWEFSEHSMIQKIFNNCLSPRVEESPEVNKRLYLNKRVGWYLYPHSFVNVLYHSCEEDVYGNTTTLLGFKSLTTGLSSPWFFRKSACASPQVVPTFQSWVYFLVPPNLGMATESSIFVTDVYVSWFVYEPPLNKMTLCQIRPNQSWVNIIPRACAPHPVFRGLSCVFAYKMLLCWSAGPCGPFSLSNTWLASLNLSLGTWGSSKEECR